MEDRVILSERPEDQRKAVEWAREEYRKIQQKKGERIAEALMEKMTPLIIQRSQAK